MTNNSLPSYSPDQYDVCKSGVEHLASLQYMFCISSHKINYGDRLILVDKTQ